MYRKESASALEAESDSRTCHAVLFTHHQASVLSCKDEQIIIGGVIAVPTMKADGVSTKLVLSTAEQPGTLPAGRVDWGCRRRICQLVGRDGDAFVGIEHRRVVITIAAKLCGWHLLDQSGQDGASTSTSSLRHSFAHVRWATTSSQKSRPLQRVSSMQARKLTSMKNVQVELA